MHNDCDEVVYNLMKGDKVVYRGVTNDPKRRLGEHIRHKLMDKDGNIINESFDRMEVMTKKIGQKKSRVLESKKLHDDLDLGRNNGVIKTHHNTIKKQFEAIDMLNKNRGRLQKKYKGEAIPWDDLSDTPIEIHLVEDFLK